MAPAGGQFEDTYEFPPFREYTQTVLNDNGERIALLDDLGAVVDEVSYDDGPPWPVTPDGLGPSLELIDPGEDNDDPRNWHASVAPTCGQTETSCHTAGFENSVSQTGLPPWIENVQHGDPQPGIDPIVVTATVQGASTVDFTSTGRNSPGSIGRRPPPRDRKSISRALRIWTSRRSAASESAISTTPFFESTPGGRG